MSRDNPRIDLFERLFPRRLYYLDLSEIAHTKRKVVVDPVASALLAPRRAGGAGIVVVLDRPLPANVYRLPMDPKEDVPIERLVLYARWQGQYLSANRRTALPIVVDIYDFAKAPSVWRERNPDDWGTLYGSQWAMDKQL